MDSNELQCQQCHKLFSKRKYFLIHIKRHKDFQYQFSCNECDEQYSSKSLLNKHINAIHRGDVHQCELCNKVFDKFEYLRAHIKLHKGIKFPCEQCDKTYNSKNALLNHIGAVHRGDKFTCSKCNKEYSHETALKRHVKINHEGSKYECKYCGQCFAMSGNRSSHEKSVHKGIKRVPKAKSKKV